MAHKNRAIILIMIGIIAVGLSISCFSRESLRYEHTTRYGGDAYTGIQNAAAKTSENVKELAEIVQFGFGSILLVMGLGFIGMGLTTPNSIRTDESTNQSVPIAETPKNEIKPEVTEKENT